MRLCAPELNLNLTGNLIRLRDLMFFVHIPPPWLDENGGEIKRITPEHPRYSGSAMQG